MCSFTTSINTCVKQVMVSLAKKQVWHLEFTSLKMQTRKRWNTKCQGYKVVFSLIVFNYLYHNQIFTRENSNFKPKIQFTTTIESQIMQLSILVMCDLCDSIHYLTHGTIHLLCQLFTNHYVTPLVFCFIRT